MFTTLTDNQRLAIKHQGTPVPMLDPTSGKPFLLVGVHLSNLPDGSVSATIPGFKLRGEGAAPDEAIYALLELVRAFKDQ